MDAAKKAPTLTERALGMFSSALTYTTTGIATAANASVNVVANNALYVATSGWNPEGSLYTPGPNRAFRTFLGDASNSPDIANLCRVSVTKFLNPLLSNARLNAMLGEGWLAGKVNEIKTANKNLLPMLVESTLLKIFDTLGHMAQKAYNHVGQAQNPEQFFGEMLMSVFGVTHFDGVCEKLKEARRCEDAPFVPYPEKEKKIGRTPSEQIAIELAEYIEATEKTLKYIKVRQKNQLGTTSFAWLYELEAHLTEMKKISAKYSVVQFENVDATKMETKTETFHVPQIWTEFYPIKQKRNEMAYQYVKLMDEMIKGDRGHTQDALAYLFKDPQDRLKILSFLRAIVTDAQKREVIDQDVEAYLNILVNLNDIVWEKGDARYKHAFNCLEIILCNAKKIGVFDRYPEHQEAINLIRRENRLWHIVTTVCDDFFANVIVGGAYGLNLPPLAQKGLDYYWKWLVSEVVPQLMLDTIHDMYDFRKDKRALDMIQKLECAAQLRTICAAASSKMMRLGTEYVSAHPLLGTSKPAETEAQLRKKWEKGELSETVAIQELHDLKASEFVDRSIRNLAAEGRVGGVEPLKQALIELINAYLLQMTGSAAAMMSRSGFVVFDAANKKFFISALLTYFVRSSGIAMIKEYQEMAKDPSKTDRKRLHQFCTHVVTSMLKTVGFENAQSLPVPQAYKNDVWDSIIQAGAPIVYDFFTNGIAVTDEYAANLEKIDERMEGNGVQKLSRDMAAALPHVLALQAEPVARDAKQVPTIGLQLVTLLEKHLGVAREQAVWIHSNLIRFLRQEGAFFAPYVESLLVDLFASMTEAALPAPEPLPKPEPQQPVDELDALLRALTAQAVAPAQPKLNGKLLPVLMANLMRLIRQEFLENRVKNVTSQQLAAIQAEPDADKRSVLISQTYSEHAERVLNQAGLFFDKLKLPKLLKPVLWDLLKSLIAEQLYDLHRGIGDKFVTAPQELAAQLNHDADRVNTLVDQIELLAENIVKKGKGVAVTLLGGTEQTIAHAAGQKINTLANGLQVRLDQPSQDWLKVETVALFKNEELVKETNKTVSNVLIYLINHMTHSVKHLLTDPLLFKKGAIGLLNTVTSHLREIQRVRKGEPTARLTGNDRATFIANLYSDVTQKLLKIVFPSGQSDLPVPQSEQANTWKTIQETIETELKKALDPYIVLLTNRQKRLQFVHQSLRNVQTDLVAMIRAQGGRVADLAADRKTAGLADQQKQLEQELLDTTSLALHYVFDTVWNRVTTVLESLLAKVLGVKGAHAVAVLTRLAVVTILGTVLKIVLYPIIVVNRAIYRKAVRSLANHAVWMISREEHINLLKNVIDHLFALLGEHYMHKGEVNPAVIESFLNRGVADLTEQLPQLIPSALLKPVWFLGGRKIKSALKTNVLQTITTAFNENLPGKQTPLEELLALANNTL